MPDPDPDYSTAMDYIYAKLMGFELEVLKKVTALDNLPAAALLGGKADQPKGSDPVDGEDCQPWGADLRLVLSRPAQPWQCTTFGNRRGI